MNTNLPKASVNPDIKTHARPLKYKHKFMFEFMVEFICKFMTGFIINTNVNVRILTAQMYGKLDSLVKPLSNPSRITLVYVNMHPMIMRLFKYGLDIFIYLQIQKSSIHLTSIYVTTYFPQPSNS